MKKLIALVMFLTLLAPAAWAADEACTTSRDGKTICPPPDSKCVNDRLGEVVCSAPGGGIELDRYSAPACGPGYRTRDRRGDVFCSSALRRVARPLWQRRLRGRLRGREAAGLRQAEAGEVTEPQGT